jgi:hypothetical protein
VNPPQDDKPVKNRVLSLAHTAFPDIAFRVSYFPLSPLFHPSPPPPLFLDRFLFVGFTKIYRYDKPIQPPVPPVPGNPTFASPKGYKINLVNGAPDPNRCCWLWLVDQDGNSDTMSV